MTLATGYAAVRPTRIARGSHCAGLLLAALLAWTVPVDAGHIRLKNGMVLNGKPSKLMSLTRAVQPNPGPTNIYQVILIQTAYQNYYVPRRQVPDDGMNFDAALIRDVEFNVPWQLKGSRKLTIQRVGGVTETVPWDAEGRRTVTLQTPGDPLAVIQGITKITPDHVMISGMNHVWEFGVGLSQIPPQTVVALLNNPMLCPPTDTTTRMARARFYIQAGWYPQADQELAQFAHDFPDLKEKADLLRQGLVQLFGAHMLRELERRREAGQFQLAEASAQRLLQAPLAGGVQRDAQQFLAENKQSRDTLTKAAALLGDLQAQLGDSEVAQQVSVMRTQCVRELDRAGLKRLQPFLQAEADSQLAPGEKLALAFTGWMLGPDAADTDLSNAQHLWEARKLVLEYLRGEDPGQRAEIFEQLQHIEGLGPNRLLKLLSRLPPVRDAEMIQPGVAQRIELPAQGDRAAGGYWVLLPPEYSPNHSYPCVLALHAQSRTGENAARFWGGTVDDPGWCQRRGYIVIAPEYAAENATEYSYGVAGHVAVLQSLRDARLRFAIDPDRVFLAGHDLGADAAFDIGLSHPDEFAGVIPIAGVPDLYAKSYVDNGTHTAWYIVRGELGRDTTDSKRPFTTWADRAFDLGYKFDVIYAQFQGRGQDSYADELPRIFDWMDLHRRRVMPKEFEFKSLRQSDNQLYWLTAIDLPRTVLLQAAAGDRKGNAGDPMKISCKITEGNTIVVQSPAKQHRIRLIDGIVDFDRKMNVSINARSKYAKLVEPDMLTMLEDFRLFGDRRRIASAALEF